MAPEPSPKPMPLLAAWSPEVRPVNLQQYTSSRVEDIDPSFYSLGAKIFRKACAFEAACSLPALTVHANPLDIREANINLSRAVYHRPTPLSYVNSMRLHMLHSVNATAIVAKRLNKALVLKDIQHALLECFQPATEVAFQEYEELSTLKESCKQQLPPSWMGVQDFNSWKAVVWLCYPGDTVDTTPKFECIAGWSRWNAVCMTLAQMEHQRFGGLVAEALSEIKIPVVILDGSRINKLDIIALATWLNLEDREPGTDVLRSINSRPYSLADRVWHISLAFQECALVLHEKVEQHDSDVEDEEARAEREKKPFTDQFVSFIKNTPQLREIWSWLKKEANAFLKTDWKYVPMAITTKDVTPDDLSVDDVVADMLSFIISLLWAVDSRKLRCLEWDTIRSLLAEEDGSIYLWSPLNMKGRSRCLCLYWDDLFLRLLPYQVQIIYSLGDLMALTRCIEVFFLPRGHRDDNPYKWLDWSLPDQTSLIKHFSRKLESASDFMTRVAGANKVRDLERNQSKGQFDSLAAFICFYNIQFLYELEDLAMVESNTLPKSIPMTQPTLLNPGVARCITQIRAIILISYLSYDNPALHLDLFRTQRPDKVGSIRLPLELPASQPPSIASFASLFLPNEEAKVKLNPSERPRLEHYFEAMIGALAEWIFRMILAGFNSDPFFPWIPTSKMTPVDKAESADVGDEADDEANPFTLRYQYQELPSRVNVLYMSVLKGGALIPQAVLRECLIASKDDKTGQLAAAIVPKLSDNQSEAVDTPAALRPSVFHAVPLPNFTVIRERAYEASQFNRAGIDPQQAPHYNLIFRIIDALLRTPRPQDAGWKAHAILCGASPRPEQPPAQSNPPQVNTMGTTELAQSAPPSTSDPTQQQQLELFGRACAERLSQMSPTVTLPPPEPNEAESGDISNGRPVNALEAQQRITRWFEERRNEVRELLQFLFSSIGQPELRIKLSADFRNRTADEARAAAGSTSDLAAESTNITSSLQEIPYQFIVDDVSVLPFSRLALEAVFEELEPVMRQNLILAFNHVLKLRETAHSVVASARPAIICALWQSLTRLSPFFDVLHPLAVQWQDLRTSLCTWLWAQTRRRLEAYWHEICAQRLPHLEETMHPRLKFSLRRLSSGVVESGQLQFVDLTPQRLAILLRGPKSLDRICSAFYRFQCSGMANAKAALGVTTGAGVPLTAGDLASIFTSAEASVHPLFDNIFHSLDPRLSAEDVLDKPRVASAGFLKRYAPYVLSGLETQERTQDLTRLAEVEEGCAQQGGEEEAQASEAVAPEPSMKRRRKDADVEGGCSRQSQKQVKWPDEIPLSLLAAGSTVLALKARAKILSRQTSIVPAAGGAGLDASSNLGSGADFLLNLPATVRVKLLFPIPTRTIFDDFTDAYNSRENGGTARKRRHDEVASGSMPILPDWFERQPCWDLWPAPITDGTDGGRLVSRPSQAVFSELPSAVLNEDAIYHGRETVSTPDLDNIPEPEWELVRSVLEFLSKKGIDGLYSRSANKLFPLTPFGAPENYTKLERDRALDEYADTGGFYFSGPPSEGATDTSTNKNLFARRACMLSLKQFLSGYSALQQTLIPIRTTVPDRSSSPSTAAAAEQDQDREVSETNEDLLAQIIMN